MAVNRIGGIVIEGNRIGRELGVRTANIALDELCTIENGVYAAHLTIEDKEFNAVVNIGHKPTIDTDSSQRGAEIHIIDWSGDLYGQYIEVELTHKLREERRFDSLEALKQQIEADIERAKVLNNK